MRDLEEVLFLKVHIYELKSIMAQILKSQQGQQTHIIL